MKYFTILMIFTLLAAPLYGKQQKIKYIGVCDNYELIFDDKIISKNLLLRILEYNPNSTKPSIKYFGYNKKKIKWMEKTYKLAPKSLKKLILMINNFYKAQYVKKQTINNYLKTENQNILRGMKIGNYKNICIKEIKLLSNQILIKKRNKILEYDWGNCINSFIHKAYPLPKNSRKIWLNFLREYKIKDVPLNEAYYCET